MPLPRLSIAAPGIAARLAARWWPRDVALLTLLLCLGQVLLWGTACWLSYSAPEVDSAEQFVWAFSLESGYWKHPPLPTWIMHGLIRAFGTSVALPFIATQACIVIALAITWRLGCEFMSPRRSLIAMVLASLVTYHNIGGDSFNHNTVLLPFQAATLLWFHRATRHLQWHQWALAGLFAGLATMVKYVAIMPLAGLLLYFAVDRRLHTRRALAGLVLGAAVCALVVVPNVLWLRDTNFLPFRYAREVTRELPGLVATVLSLGDFGLTQLIRVLPLLLGLAWMLWPRRAQPAAAEPEIALAPQVEPADRAFVWITALAPLVMTVAVGLFSEVALQGRWGANAFLLAGLLPMLVLRRPDSATLLRRCLQAAIVLHVVLCIGQTLGKTVLADRFERRTRANFPGAVLAHEAQRTWSEHTGVPLRLVVSDIWLGGNVIAHSPQRLAVLIDGRHFKSPWVPLEAVERCGALILDDTTDDRAGHAHPLPQLDELMAHADNTGTWTLPWAHAPARPDTPSRGTVRWGVILPREPQRCDLR